MNNEYVYYKICDIQLTLTTIMVYSITLLQRPVKSIRLAFICQRETVCSRVYIIFIYMWRVSVYLEGYPITFI